MIRFSRPSTTVFEVLPGGRQRSGTVMIPNRIHESHDEEENDPQISRLRELPGAMD